MISNSKDFIFNSDLEYPPIRYQGKLAVTASTTVTLKTGVPAGLDYQVFGTVVNGTYGTGLERRLAWIDAAGNLKCTVGANGFIYWRIYAY